MNAALETKIPLPPKIANALVEFLAKGRTGNIRLNVNDGKILGAHVTEIINCKTNRARIVGHGMTRRS